MTCEELAKLLSALGHEMRLRIVSLLASRREMYLSEIASSLNISRALAKVHLKVLERAGLVESRLVLDEERGRALRFYRISGVDQKLLELIRGVCGNERER